jgi:hypothetical protein
MSRLFFWPATNCGNHQTKHTDDMATHRRSREISDGEEGEIQSADEVEALLIEEVRRLGNTSMGQGERGRSEGWRRGSEEKSRQLLRKKNG